MKRRIYPDATRSFSLNRTCSTKLLEHSYNSASWRRGVKFSFSFVWQRSSSWSWSLGRNGTAK